MSRFKGRVDMKPLSVNEAWKGRRFKSEKYKEYETACLYYLRALNLKNLPTGNLKIIFHFGFSNKSSDIDNPLKSFIDILQKRYKFNDNRIYALEVTKEDVAIGSEFIEFEILSYGK